MIDGTAADIVQPPVGDSAWLPASLRERLLDAVRRRHPRKSFGYLVAEAGSTTPTDFVLFDSNIRNEPGWRERFESYGTYFVEHPDAGFVASPDETWRRQKEIWARGMVEIAMFHSHRRHPGNFSRIDFDMHAARFPTLWHLIVSMRNPAMPQLRAFAICGSGARELEIDTACPSLPWDRPIAQGYVDRDATIALARQLLELDRHGRPRRMDAGPGSAASDILWAIAALADAGQDVFGDIVMDGFLRDRGRRYQEHVAPTMQVIGADRSSIGTALAARRHFCGEVPDHVVELEPFALSRLTVTNELYGLFDATRLDAPIAARTEPVVRVTWFEATLFAIWMGCRLPTEAEWEHACGGGSAGEWCCDNEADLRRFAWYSENSGGMLQSVATRAPNALGLFDMHGNVWEWCLDTYDQDAYPRHAPQPSAEPAHRGLGDVRSRGHRASRGGSYYSLSEMCRKSFRAHDPPSYSAQDIGFRLARSAGPLLARSADRG